MSLHHRQLTFKTLWQFVIAIIFMMTVTFSSTGSADTDDGRAMLEKAVNGWKHLLTSTSPITATATTVSEAAMTDRNDPGYGKKNVTKYSYTFLSSEKSKKVIVDVFDGSEKWQRRVVVGSNPEYGFRANQIIENGPYFISECIRDQKPYDHVNAFLNAFFVKLLAPVSVCAVEELLPDIVARDSFKLLGAQRIEKDNHSYVELRFSFLPIDTGPRDDKTPISCTFIVDPAADWRAVSAFEEGRGVTIATEIIYDGGEVSDGLRKVTWDRTLANSKGFETFEIASISHEPPTEREFYLPSLGLPDCAELRTSGNRRLLFIAINLLVIGVILSILSHRRRASTRVRVHD
jgi:hypothetical protein